MRKDNENNKPIGGYFSLELPIHEEFHKNAIKLNTGRNCLEYILRCCHYQKIYIPFYTCEVILEPIEKLGVTYEFYHITQDFEIAGKISLNANEALLYTNYYGLKQQYINSLAKEYKQQLIIDNSQAFFSKPIDGIDTFYSCRKFFGVPDGAYLYTNAHANFKIKQDISYRRIAHLTKRIDLSPEKGFEDFHRNGEKIKGQDIKSMSKLTQRMMQAIDYSFVAQQRKENFMYLHNHLQQNNMLNIDVENIISPMIYPYFTKKEGLRKELIENKIYVAQYWPNVLKWTNKKDLEYYLTTNILPLPIDQRYNQEDMSHILEILAK